MSDRTTNVGARLTVVGRSAFLSALKEAQAAVDRLNASMAAGAAASKESAAAQDAFYAGGAKSLALAATVGLILGPAVGVYLAKKFGDAAGSIKLVTQGYMNAVKAVLRWIGVLSGEAAAEGAATAENLTLAGSMRTVAGAEAAEATGSRALLGAFGPLGLLVGGRQAARNS